MTSSMDALFMEIVWLGFSLFSSASCKLLSERVRWLDGESFGIKEEQEYRFSVDFSRGNGTLKQKAIEKELFFVDLRIFACAEQQSFPYTGDG